MQHQQAHLVATPPAAAFISFFGYVGTLAPTVYKAAASDPDTLTYDQAMSDLAHKEEWLAAAQKEVSSLESKGTWTEVPLTKAKTRVIPGTWVFRRKRTPDGTVKKYKARYCVRGDLQEGQFETYAPVVSWSTVRVFIVLSLTLHWPTISIDFSNAFVQAVLEDPVWIHVPRGFRSLLPGTTCLRLNKSLYGLVVAPRLWNQTLVKALLSLGFVASPFDACFFLRDDAMIVLYVDDAGIAAIDIAVIDKIIDDLLEQGFELTREGSFAEFLGIKFTSEDANTIVLTQRGLVQKILEATCLQDSNPNRTPTTQLALGSDPEGAPMKEAWGYASVVGMLLYLSTNTRPDISFAVSQVARYTADPKQSHATAVKTIVRYLKGTIDNGMIIRPTGTLDLEAYVDADFAGLYKREPDHNPNAVRSRTGYIITLGGAPLLWKSQLQTEISLSTLEAEYSALSQCMRVVLPLRALIQHTLGVIEKPRTIPTTFKCIVFEDNMGAYYLATNQRITARTKYFLIKWHHFWDAVNRGDVQVVKVETGLQNADYLTKGLPQEVFQANRYRVQGWLAEVHHQSHLQCREGES